MVAKINRGVSLYGAVILVSCVSSITGFETVNFQHLSLNSMFPQITMNGLYQDESGILWLSLIHI